jgi:rhombotail lipoprotein
MMHARWLLPLLFIILPACSMSHGFDREGIQEALHQRLTLVGEREAADPKEKLPVLTGPFRLGIYFMRTEFPTRQSVQPVEWLSVEKDLLIQHLKPLRDDQIVREIVTLAESTALNLTRRELRQAAVRYGIDVLLLVDGIGAVDRHNNAYSLLYPTILGAYLAPGTISDALFVIDGRVWDVRTDAVGDRKTAEGTAQQIGTAVMVEDADALRAAKHLAIEAFGAVVVEHLRSFTGGRTGAPSTLR